METKREIESSGSNVDAAIFTGLEELGVERDAVEVEVLDEGNRGLLGIGARPARVRLTVAEKFLPEEEPSPSPTSIATPERTATDEVGVVSTDQPPAQAVLVEELSAETVSVAQPPSKPVTIEEQLQNAAPIARQTLNELLEKMGIHAHIEDYIKTPQDAEDYHKLILNVRGKDLGALIGRRGETLDALQYLTRLIVGREVERRVSLVVDVEGYRVRRERSLRRLALRMAERAVATGRRQVLEPMSAAERRIVHVTLRHHAEVATESIGQDENRKVTIFLRGSN